MIRCFICPHMIHQKILLEDKIYALEFKILCNKSDPVLPVNINIKNGSFFNADPSLFLTQVHVFGLMYYL